MQKKLFCRIIPMDVFLINRLIYLIFDFDIILTVFKMIANITTNTTYMTYCRE